MGKKRNKPPSYPETEAELLDLAEFYSADAETLQIKYRQIEKLIGRSHHAASEGDYCEALLKEFLRRTLPRQFSVDGGFIRKVSATDFVTSSRGVTTESVIATPQLDIIVHDSTDYAPLFRSEDFVVVLPEAVRAIIEVKKCLTWQRLDEAVKNISETRCLLRHWRHESNKVFTCIFAFTLGEDLGLKRKEFSTSFENRFRDSLNQDDGFCDAPDLLMVLPKLALHRSDGTITRFFYCPTTPEGQETPNIAGQFLLFLLTTHTNMVLSRAIPYPERLRSRRKLAFEIAPNIHTSK